MAQGVSELNLPKIFQSGVESFFFYILMLEHGVSVSRPQVQEHYMLKSLVGKCSHQMGDLPAPVLWKAGNLGMVMTEAVLPSKDTTFSSPPL